MSALIDFGLQRIFDLTGRLSMRFGGVSEPATSHCTSSKGYLL